MIHTLESRHKAESDNVEGFKLSSALVMLFLIFAFFGASIYILISSF